MAGLAWERTKLYAARLGATLLSYQVMIQRPGMSIFMLSFQRPPLYQAGSFGVRSAMGFSPEGVGES
jgi:hypothetical protein